MDDEQLINATLAGDSSAFGMLVHKYQDRLYNTLTHLLGSPEDARDIVQDAFVKAFVKLETFERASAFYTWLYRIAFNAAVSSQRRQRPAVSIQQQREDWGHELAGGDPPPDDRLQRQELAGQVQAALAKLTEEHRTIVVLREIDGCDYETISSILDLPVGTVRSRLHRARLQLRAELKQVLQADLS